MQNENQIYRYQGVLDTYFETGMESLAFIVLDDRCRTPNPNYDPAATKGPNNVPEWRSLNYALVLQDGDYLEVFSKDGTMIEWSGVITKDRFKIAKKEYRYSLMINEVDDDTWFRWFGEQRKVIAHSKEVPLADDPKMKEYYENIQKSSTKPSSGSSSTDSGSGS